MTLGISNINGGCSTWKGVAYFTLISKGEKFKFKFPEELENLLYICSSDFSLGYYEIPKKYQDLLDVSFFVNRYGIYIIKRK